MATGVVVGRRHRPAAVSATTGLLMFLGLSALAGGVEVVCGATGAALVVLPLLPAASRDLWGQPR